MGNHLNGANNSQTIRDVQSEILINFMSLNIKVQLLKLNELENP